MELMLQFGFGMMAHSRELIAAWGGGTTILSPRDLTDQQLRRLAADLTAISGGRVLIDPQFYLPHSDHARLCSHSYWPVGYQTGPFWGGPSLATLIAALRDLNVATGASGFILPGTLCTTVDDDWLACQAAIIEEAAAVGHGDQLIATVALAEDVVKNPDQIHELLEASAGWNVSGWYLVCEHPNGDYLVKDPIWLSNVLDLCAGVRLRGHTMIVGYCTHQMLACGAASATAICSGTWMNVRSFPPEKFQTNYEDEIRQRSKWYYAPASLSEYKLPFLDIARAQGVLPSLQAAPALQSHAVDSLFSGQQPTTVGMSEQSAFRHYLQCLRFQTANSRLATFDATVASLNAQLDAAEVLLRSLHQAGVRGQARDFGECIDVNRAAVALHASTRGPVLRNQWTSLA